MGSNKGKKKSKPTNTAGKPPADINSSATINVTAKKHKSPKNSPSINGKASKKLPSPIPSPKASPKMAAAEAPKVPLEEKVNEADPVDPFGAFTSTTKDTISSKAKNARVSVELTAKVLENGATGVGCNMEVGRAESPMHQNPADNKAKTSRFFPPAPKKDAGAATASVPSGKKSGSWQESLKPATDFLTSKGGHLLELFTTEIYPAHVQPMVGTISSYVKSDEVEAFKTHWDEALHGDTPVSSLILTGSSGLAVCYTVIKEIVALMMVFATSWLYWFYTGGMLADASLFVSKKAIGNLEYAYINIEGYYGKVTGAADFKSTLDAWSIDLESVVFKTDETLSLTTHPLRCVRFTKITANHFLELIKVVMLTLMAIMLNTSESVTL